MTSNTSGSSSSSSGNGGGDVRGSILPLQQQQRQVGSLTPLHRSDEIVSDATYEMVLNGIVTLIPSVALLGLAMRHSPAFVQRTNWQSRTAITIMPATFVAFLTSEQKLMHSMRDMAVEAQHSHETVKWAEAQWKEEKARRDQLQQQQQQQSTAPGIATASTAIPTLQHRNYGHLTNEQEHIQALYLESVRQSGVCIVPELLWWHKTANYVQQNPVKLLAGCAVPAIGYIFYGRHGKQLELASKLMHTRVLGQALTVGMLLGIMGFKELMDRNGRYISQADADDRVYQMHLVRQSLQDRLEAERRRQEELDRELADALTQDLEATAKTMKKSKKKRAAARKESSTAAAAAPPSEVPAELYMQIDKE